MKYKRLTALLSASILLLSGCSGLPRERSQTYTDTLFDTVISVQIFDSVDEDVLKGCEKLCKKYDSMFSNKIEDSEISRINSAGGNPVEVSKETIKLIMKGIYYSEMSDGAFDITIAPVSSLWDFKAETPSVPSPEAIAEAVSHVNYENIIIRDNTVKLADPQAGIDLGAIAKGYIADRIKDYLEEEGVRHAMINLGGNVLAMGSKLDGSDYNIGIQKPFDETGEPITSVKISDKSVVTSGIYQRYFKEDGKIYHHILDPNTGYPCENNLYSVTILTDSSLTADALSTTCFLLGYDRGMKLINQLDNVDAVFITNDNQIHYSKNFQNNQ
ncbi:MAG: FAD:protein FMN transferase [[Clostridium] scindens]|uniref:FAD:protein FMN transferase n=1 Tax=Clostridium scindens (strain JCM 10418 / VPI 12708) TaxID=29347 RepID=UPI002B1FD865|nr:FAD:protein FMN transferase [[Clostridium] scindens]MEA4817436.1 FAD:protein FMN transferase [[Clostridium] scindens]